MRGQTLQMILWVGALVAGTILGLYGGAVVADVMTFIATVYTRLFRFLAVPTIALAITTTLMTVGSQKDTGHIFRRTLTYTLLTTFAAAGVALVLYLIIAPSNLPAAAVSGAASAVPESVGHTSYMDYVLGIVPDNVFRPFIDGNVLSVLLLSVAVGLAIGKMPDNDRKPILVNALLGLQDLVFILIRGLIRVLPLGIMAFAAQFATQMSAGVAMSSLGRYAAVILGGNLLQMFVILPLFLIVRGINPLRALRQMMPAVVMALLTKSSAATLPVTMQTAEERMGVDRRVSRFVLPICTTINMNGCAAFILVTSLFVMQNAGMTFPPLMLLLWLVISVFSAIGNAGVPMGCFFLTLSLTSSMDAPVAVLGLILPLYTIIDMVETAENVWSDSCVCAMTDKDMAAHRQP